MTARLPSEPVRVTNWLAGWLDYVFAMVLVAGRCLRPPAIRRAPQPVMLTAFGPTAETYQPSWNSPVEDNQTGGLVKIAEIVMLSVSFFIAAHLLSGGTPTVAAPNLNPLGLLPDHVRAQTLPIPAVTGPEITVPAGSFVQAADPPVEAATLAEAELPEALAVLAPPSEPEAGAAMAAPEREAPAPAQPLPAVAEQPAPLPTPAPASAAVESPESTVTARYLTVEEIRAAATAAGWPATLLPDVEKVAWCESRYHTHAEYLGAQGLMQMMPSWFVAAGLDPAKWWDPEVNFRAAKFAYDLHFEQFGNGWLPWTCRP